MVLLELLSRRSRPLNIFLHHRWQPIPISSSSESLSLADAISSKRSRLGAVPTMTSFSQSKSDFGAQYSVFCWGKRRSGSRRIGEGSGSAWTLPVLKSSLREALLREILLRFTRAEARGVKPRFVGLATGNFASRRTGGTVLIVPDSGDYPMGVPTAWLGGRPSAILVVGQAVRELLRPLVLKPSVGTWNQVLGRDFLDPD